jgi:tRNA pseudouridine38-40 synthase
MKIKITLSYNGAFFRGFAPDIHKQGVVNSLQKVFSKININSKITGSGRTDKGVHALNQVVDIDIPSIWEYKLNTLKDILNKNLQYIKIKYISIVDDNFNSRFDAKKRVYRYIISTKELTPFNQDYFTYINEKDINEDKIKQSIKAFIGTYNFKFFKKEGSANKSDIRIIHKAYFYKYKDYYIFYFLANSYLRNQIRLMVNFLLEISKGNLTIEDLKEQLECKYIYCKKPVLPNGLYLSKIIY